MVRLSRILTILTIVGVMTITLRTLLIPIQERLSGRAHRWAKFKTDINAASTPFDAAEARELDRAVHVQHALLHPEHKEETGGGGEEEEDVRGVVEQDAVADVATHAVHHHNRSGEEGGFRGAFAHMFREDVSQCEYEVLGWGAVRSRVEAAVDVCVGATTISCALFPHAREWFGDDRAYFCWARNVVEYPDRPLARGAGPGMRRLEAHCEWTAGAQRFDFWRELGPRHWDMRGGEKSTMEVTSDPLPPGLATADDVPYLHLVVGDCKTGNPGHCIADPHNFFIVQQLLNATAATSTAVLIDGFTPQTVAEAWWALVGNGLFVSSSDLPKAPAGTPPRILPLVAWSPNSAYGPHWQNHRGASEHCHGKSQLLLSYGVHIAPFLDAHTVHALPGLLDNGTINICHVLYTHGVCTTGACFAIGKACDHAPERGLIVYARRTTYRYLRNADEVIEAIAAAFPAHVVVAVDFGMVPFHIQYLLRRSARVVIGVHGGAIWGALDTLRQGQALVEIMPMLGPGTSCYLATMVNVAYYPVHCRACTPKDHHIGRVSPDVIVSAVGTALVGDTDAIVSGTGCDAV